MSASHSVLDASDLASFLQGTHTQLAAVLGAHHFAERGGTQFSVWAPRARSVSVVGDFNGWDRTRSPLLPAGAGIWTGFFPNTFPGSHYKYHVVSEDGSYRMDKADPFAFYNEAPPNNASLIWDLSYKWADDPWMQARRDRDLLRQPLSIYEVHIGSWRRGPDNRWLSYSQVADRLTSYVAEMGFTHVEFLPVMEHPFYGSWGYQPTGFFAPTSRYGSPQDFMQLIDRFHARGIGVILDWVPSHFPTDDHALGFFDGAHEYESDDPRKSIHPDWKSYVFDYARSEVRSFLLSSALFWLTTYHIDALRVDAVASMLYLDYSRGPGQWTPNEYGGHENLDAIAFLRTLNDRVTRALPDVATIAEESTAWPGVTRPPHKGGLGFGLKWDMGWMHDTLAYMARDPIQRKYHHAQLTFRADYAFNENFVLPLSHDEVVYGKGSLLRKMPGNHPQQFAGLRLLLAYMFAQPGKKLLFMGDEFGVWSEWNHDSELQWDLLAESSHAGVRLLVGDLNHLYRSQPALWTADTHSDSFAWIERSDAERNVIAFERRGTIRQDSIVVVCNFSGAGIHNYRLGVPQSGEWHELFNSDALDYGGSGIGNFGVVPAMPVPLHGFPFSVTLQLAPLSAIYLSRPLNPSANSRTVAHRSSDCSTDPPVV